MQAQELLAHPLSQAEDDIALSLDARLRVLPDGAAMHTCPLLSRSGMGSLERPCHCLFMAVLSE